MPAVWATALAAAGAYVRRLLLLHAPGTHQLLAALYSALPRGTTTVLTTIFSGLVATLAVLLLRPRVLRAGVKNVVPFLAVAGSTALAVLVPLAIGLAITSLGLLSFGPMVMAYLAGRWLLLSVTTRLLLASILPLGVLLWSLALYQIVRRNGREGMWQLLWQGTHTLRIYMSFLLPFYTPFAILLVGAFSLVWGASIGAFMFIQGEVFADWSGAARRRWPGMLALCELLFAGAVFDYFPITVRRGTTALRLATGDEPPLRSDRRYLFCYHPHGVYAFGLFALLFGKRSRFHQLFQQPPRSNRSTNERSGSRSPSPSSSTGGRRRATTSPSPSPPPPQQQRGMLIGVANALLHVPMVCTFLSWFGFIPVAPGCLAEACSSQHNVSLVPGGIAEMTAYQGTHVEVLSLLERKGFVRLALQHGRDLVPVYGFGENRAFKQYTCFRKTRNKLARRLRLALHLFRGRWFTLIPFRHPIAVVVGAPIEVGDPVATPSEEQVDALHKRYCEAIRELYYAHRAAHGYGETELVLI